MRRVLVWLAAVSVLVAVALVGANVAVARTVNRPCAHKIASAGDRGICVKDLSFLYTAPGAPAVRHGVYWRVRPPRLGLTSFYGDALRRETRRIKFRLGFKRAFVDGRVAGPLLRAYLLGKRQIPVACTGHVACRNLAGKRRNAYEYARKHATPATNGKLAALITMARRSIELNRADGNRFYYTQGSHRIDFLDGFNSFPEGGDCSGSIWAMARHVGLKSPGTWTGDMQSFGSVSWTHGQPLTRLLPGDLIFYGHTRPFDHVAMVLDYHGHVYTDGSTTCPCEEPVLYRFDAYLARRNWR